MSAQPIHFVGASSHPLAEKLKKNVDGEILFDAASRGRYATDASIYQIMPVGVVVPRTADAALAALQIAAEAGVPILPRGAGTSQCGQTVGAALVIDNSKYLNQLVSLDVDAKRAVVQPGMVLDHLNAQLKAHGLWYPVDVSTSAQATLGGMAGNNSCGSRSIAYGNMVHRVAGIDAWLPSGDRGYFGRAADMNGPVRIFAEKAAALWAREQDEIAARFPTVQRRVAGYNLDELAPDRINLGKLLVGSEGTLAYFERLHLDLAPLPVHKTLGVCHFPKFYDGMNAAQYIVELDPCAVELVDRTMLDLSRRIPAFKKTVGSFLKGEPDCVLLVEFAGDDHATQVNKLKQLGKLMHGLGFPEGVVEIIDPALQKAVWDVRKAGLNIMMSMKGEGKPVSFIEDCAVPLEHLAEYTRRLTEVFHKHGTEGTWYAHASVGCLHVRPILNMRADGAQKMRAIAEEAAELVREYKGAYSGEHGDGLVRSEWIAPFFGPRLTAALSEIKSWFDPKGLMNPGKIVNPPKQDDRSLFRFKPDYAIANIRTGLDWSEWGNDAAGGLASAVEMCNNNGHCRKFDSGTMCPSYRVTRDERHVTRGRANTLRLALSNQLQDGSGFTSDSVKQVMDLCVSCKGCKRDCPTGVDMAKMKIEFLHQYKQTHGFTLKDRAIAYLPRYAAWAKRLAPLVNAVQGLGKPLLGFAGARSLPAWHGAGMQPTATRSGAPEVVLFADTFNCSFEPDNVSAAVEVLQAAGYQVHFASKQGDRPACCGRTFLSAGMLDEARAEVRRTLDILKPFVERGVSVVGLEPSCLLTLRDEFRSLLPGTEADALAAKAMLFEEFLVSEKRAGRLDLPLQALPETQALVHGHCHQKAFDAFSPVLEVLKWIPGLKVEAVESSCCGMAGAFGYEAEHFEVSMKMAELSLLPAVRKAGADTLIVADGTSCRHQIQDGASREAVHVAKVLARAVRKSGSVA
ncbi:MAG: FAD-linked oxidase C-terminal domain-containing protein [Burkholderiales bacterium]|nr:FAD-linked oxidase C-terminal domain-containing protein [Burkholderiales bacterium]